MPSAARTLQILYPSGSPLRGVRAAAPPPAWPEKSSADVLDYTLDLSRWLTDGNDGLLSASVAVTPTGDPKDMASTVPLFLAVSGQVLLFFAGGNLRTYYKTAISIATVAGRKLTVVPQIFVNSDSPATAPVFSIGGVSMVAFDLTSTGTSIANALPLSAQYNVLINVPAGSGVKLPPFPPVPITIIHRHFGGAPLLVYPPDHDASNNPISAAFDGLAPGAPRQIAAPLASGTETEATFLSETLTRIVGAW